MHKPQTQRKPQTRACPPQCWTRRCDLKPQNILGSSQRRIHTKLTSFEQGTGYDPELLARRAVWEMRDQIRHPRFDHAMDTLIALVSTRAERVWAAHAYWRKRWRLCRETGNPSLLMVFFRHWTEAAAVRENAVPRHPHYDWPPR